MRITLEEGLYELCARRIAKDTEFLKKSENPVIYDNGSVIVDEKLFQEYRLYQLRETVERVYEHTRFYRKAFDEAGVNPEDIRSLEDISKLPFTVPNDLRGTGYDFLTMSQRYVEKPVTFYSSGTTGIKKRILFSGEDVKRIAEFISRAMHALTDNEDTRVLSLMFNSLGRGASKLYSEAIGLVGMQGFPEDMEGTPEAILKASVEHRCNVWFADVICVYRLAKEVEGTFNLKQLGLKLLYLTMGNIADPVKDYLEKSFGCPVATHYGLTEAGWGYAVDQEGCTGYQTNELDIILEIVDEKTGKVLEPGEIGEIVMTVIGRDAMPLIRYRTGDISSLIPGEHPRRQVLQHIIRRREGVYRVDENHLIYPAMLEDILFRFNPVIDYRPYVIDGRLHLQIETMNTDQELAACIEQALAANESIAAMSAMPTVELLPADSLKKYCYEKKHIICE